MGRTSPEGRTSPPLGWPAGARRKSETRRTELVRPCKGWPPHFCPYLFPHVVGLEVPLNSEVTRASHRTACTCQAAAFVMAAPRPPGHSPFRRLKAATQLSSPTPAPYAVMVASRRTVPQAKWFSGSQPSVDTCGPDRDARWPRNAEDPL